MHQWKRCKKNVDFTVKQRVPLESWQAGADVTLTSVHTAGNKYGTVVNI